MAERIESCSKPRDPAQREEWVIRYVPLVKYVVERVMISIPPPLEMDDLIGAGTLGLLDAMEKFDPSKGMSFENYASLRIRGAVLDELRSLQWKPRSIHREAQKLERAYRQVEQRLGRRAEIEEVAEELGISVEEFHRRIREVRGVNLISLDDPIGSEKGGSLSIEEVVGDEGIQDPSAALEDREAREILLGVIAGLPERERMVITLYYYEGMTQREIGRALGISESRVCQIHAKTMTRLRARLRGVLSRETPSPQEGSGKGVVNAVQG